MKPGTLIIILIIVLTVIGLKGRGGEVLSMISFDGHEMNPIAVHDATVSDVIDGNTIILTDDSVVKLLQADAPRAGEGEECFGHEARRWLRNQLPEGTGIQLKRDPNLPEEDADGNLLRYVYRSSDKLFINQRLIQTGAGAPYFDDGEGVHAETFEHLAQEARKAPVGLWRVCEDTPYDTDRRVNTGPPIEEDE